MSDNTKKAQCKRCFHFFSKDSNSTLKHHISHPHCEALKRVAESGQSPMSRDGSIFVYSPDVLREQFAGLVIQRGLPFNHFDDEQTTTVFQNHLQLKYNHSFLSSWFIDSLEGLYNIYYTKYSNPTTTESSSGGGASSSRASGGNQMTQLLNWLKEYKNKKARSDPSLSSEHERYVHSNFVIRLQTTEFATFDVLGFWKAKKTMFPVLSRKAMDILSVQATSVAFESEFSTSGRVLSIRRTRLTPASLEMCMCLKDHLDTQERKQEILDAEVQENESIPLSDEEIALDAASTECAMSEPGSRGEEGDNVYDMTNYHDDY
ncbi:zinc finger BED domain-containing protein RICESLEEPER 2 [Tanacetum coccineum]|uniref:Zinc finger BED domain-containing protein RICESLEEPER 2 n=1 Tax=Tanacetum coccineum TaxID=301880 RepID=A0ABQ4X890_9ASTR